MVRINLIKPTQLADQHLIAEYNEILMLLGYVKKYPEPINIPPTYRLGEGHIKFFKNKILYLQKRHKLLKKEMKKRGFATNKTIELKIFDKKLQNDWKPRSQDKEIIKERIRQKIKSKPNFYSYYRKHETEKFLLDLLE